MSSHNDSGSETEILSDASIGTYKRALNKLQAARNQATIQLANKDKCIADIVNQGQTARSAPPEENQSGTKSKNVYIVDANERVEIQKCARKFTYMNLFWLRPTDTKIFELNINLEYNPRNRYLSTEEEVQGILFDLLTILPEKWHFDMHSHQFKTQFLHEMSQQRSNACTRLHQTGPLILNCSNDVFHDQNRRVNTFKELIGFVVKGDGTESYNTLAPILYKEDPNQTDNKWTIFRHPMLMKTYSALVRGAGSIKGLAEGQVTQKDTRSNFETKWGVRCITPGAIAMAAILARFVGSGDATLLTCGSETKINYQKDYEFYFQYLHKGLHSNKPSVVDIFKTWNEIFYPNFVEHPNHRTMAHNEDLNTLLDELDAEEVEERPVHRGSEESGNNTDALLSQTEMRTSTPVIPDEGTNTFSGRMSSPLSNPPEHNQRSPLADVRNTSHSDHHIPPDFQASMEMHPLAKKQAKRKAIQSEEEQDENESSRPVKQPRRSG